MFSRNTIIETLSIYDNSSHSVISRLLLRFGLEEIAPQGDESKVQRMTRTSQYLIHNPTLTGPSGGNLVYEIIEYIIEEYERTRPGLIAELKPDVINYLRKDGFIIEEGRLQALLPDTLQLAEKEDELSSLLQRHNFTTSKGHLDQALSAYARGDWAASNAQLRTFIESFFDEIAYNLADAANPAPTTNSHARREFLAQLPTPFFEPALNEFFIGRQGGFIQGFWSRLHPTGAHPGLSDEEDCTFRVHLVLLVSHHYIKSFDERN